MPTPTTAQLVEARSQAYLRGDRAEVARLNAALSREPRKVRSLEEVFAEMAEARANRGRGTA
jgi:hypothetical protein